MIAADVIAPASCSAWDDSNPGAMDGSSATTLLPLLSRLPPRFFLSLTGLQRHLFKTFPALFPFPKRKGDTMQEVSAPEAVVQQLFEASQRGGN